MVSQGDTRLDASNISTRLWIGGQPPFDVDLPSFDLLVLCARELQPTRVAFHGRVVRCPLRDAVLDHQELATAVLAAKEVGDMLIGGGRVLVTCAMGRNRSALVAGLALAMVTRMTADQIIRLIRARRDNSLTNEHFRDILQRLVTRSAPRVVRERR
jgi:protein-tyrosine phosphatase